MSFKDLLLDSFVTPALQLFKKKKEVDFIDRYVDMNNNQIGRDDVVACFDLTYQKISFIGEVKSISHYRGNYYVWVEYVVDGSDVSHLLKGISNLWVKKLSDDEIVELKLSGYTNYKKEEVCV